MLLQVERQAEEMRANSEQVRVETERTKERLAAEERVARGWRLEMEKHKREKDAWEAAKAQVGACVFVLLGLNFRVSQR